MKIGSWCVFMAFVVAGCNGNKGGNTIDTKQAEGTIASVYYGGDIITMEGDSAQYAGALVERDGKIAFVGSREEAMKQAGEGHQMVDLKGHTLIPGFIDGHVHFFGLGGQAATANILPSPDGNCNDIPAVIRSMKAWTGTSNLAYTNGWIAGMGFDDAVLKEGRFLTRHDLDLVSKDTPVIAVHITGHMAVMNTRGLEMAGITASTPNPTGGVIRREKDGKTPNGVLEETAAIPEYVKVLTPASVEGADYFLNKGQQLALSFGYTTIQEGKVSVGIHKAIESFATRGKLKLDVAGYLDIIDHPSLSRSGWIGPTYRDHYRLAGLKITMDGSPSGRTAWRTKPYLIPPDGQKKGYKGYPAIPEDKDVFRVIDTAYANDWQLIAHTNGDAAIDQLIRAVAYGNARYGTKDRKTVMIHGQFTRRDQLDSFRKYNIYASLFPLHTFYWGDWYKKIVEPEQAIAISPIASALKNGVRVTSHTDAPVGLPNLMMVMWTTVNRVSRSGAVIGASERLTPYQALQCVTIWGADQHMEQDLKGSLKVGKLADMVILDQNPLKIEPMKLKDVLVLETIKEGKSVYKK